MHQREPIVAIATPYGESAIGIIRASGDNLITLTSKFLHFRSRIKPWRATMVKVIDPVNNSIIDEGIVTFFKAPKSYTGEDMLELSLHGNPLLLHRVLELFLDAGIRLSMPGEFTKRAFLNGKIDLTQASALPELIGAKTHLALESAMRQLRGELSQKLLPLRDEILRLSAYLEAQIEFSEEGIPTLTHEEILDAFRSILSKVESLLISARAGELLKAGFNIVVVGLPNAGKSSLFNRLLGFDRSIVSDIPGTTRDFISESLKLSGALITLFDTAGIRFSKDPVELEGVKRSIEKIRQANLAIHVIDGSSPPSEGDLYITSLLEGIDTIRVLNKSDLGINPEHEDGIRLSALTGDGINTLKGEVLSRLGVLGDSPAILLSSRQLNHLKKSKEVLKSTIDKLQVSEIFPEILMVEIRELISALDELLGINPSEDLLSEIFSRFCIGK
ncbi:MAG: tRNA uridine-5-carboxymethylaminomethyl(34) synthesis GTPase MnmE [Aquificaceae bacterium]|nr:tRNA uridine-5-carboxymethylaminomethyl(34) synthesis GTPase MnmE [Aquificaceae bacterium]